MENASKALIIAGAILLAILIIGLGIFIYRQAANTVSDTGMDQLAIQQFNGQFENYLDKNMSGTTEGSDGYVACDKTKADIEAGKKYKATVAAENGKTSAGMIKKITISDATD